MVNPVDDYALVGEVEQAKIEATVETNIWKAEAATMEAKATEWSIQVETDTQLEIARAKHVQGKLDLAAEARRLADAADQVRQKAAWLGRLT